MLSAQKQETPSHTPPEVSQPPPTTGFGKVLQSVQGLQQRLDDFSIEEVSSSHARAHELIRDLVNLQARLNALAKLKEATLKINSQIAAIPKANFDLVEPDSLEKYPQLRALLQAGKLVREHRSRQAAQANAQSVPSADESAVSSSTSASTMEPAQIERTAPKNDGVAPPLERAASSTVAQGAKPPRTYEFSELRLVEPPQAVSLPENDSPESAMAGAKHPPAPTNEKPKGKPHFDQRLLNELIQTYGEFVISTKPAGGTERSEITPAAQERSMPADTGPTPEQPTARAVSPVRAREIVARELVPVEPAFVQPGGQGLLALPGPAEQSAGPCFDEAPTTAKTRGEIDRQLKSIIKDYGEVDLYSHHRSPKIKPVTIAAATALILLLGAFYFFKSPSTPAPASIDAVAPAAETQNPSAKKILK